MRTIITYLTTFKRRGLWQNGRYSFRAAKDDIRSGKGPSSINCSCTQARVHSNLPVHLSTQLELSVVKYVYILDNSRAFRYNCSRIDAFAPPNSRRARLVHGQGVARLSRTPCNAHPTSTNAPPIPDISSSGGVWQKYVERFIEQHTSPGYHWRVVFHRDGRGPARRTDEPQFLKGTTPRLPEIRPSRSELAKSCPQALSCL